MFVILSAIISFLTSLITTPFVIKYASRWGLVDDPSRRKHPAHTHTGIIPRAGGIPIFVAIFISSLLFIYMSKIMMVIIVGAFLILLMGLADDRWDLSPYIRFILSIFIVAFVVGAGLGIPYISNPFGQIIDFTSYRLHLDFFGEKNILILSDALAIFWIVFIMNIVNWSKGVDGQLPGFVAVASFITGILALRFSAHDIASFDVAIFSFIVGAAYIGFLPWNFYPQKIMPGYGGGALAGYFLGVLSILSWSKIGLLVLLLTIPVIDSVYVILTRIKSHRSPFRGDAGHLHHRLLRIGWGKRRIAVFYWLVSLLFGFVALQAQRNEKYILFLFAIVFISLFLIIIEKIHRGELVGSSAEV